MSLPPMSDAPSLRTPGDAAATEIPADLAALVLSIGEAEWGATAALSSGEHAAHVHQSVEITAREFGQDDPQPMNGLYVAGTETVICHTGTSPNSGDIARALTGAWNHLLAACQAQASTGNRNDGSSPNNNGASQ